jgi:hypothetical protein
MQPKQLRIGQSQLISRYLTAKELLIRFGFGPEIDWQDSLRASDFSATDFFREAAWVILSSGMREKVIRSTFPKIETAFCNWDHELVEKNRSRCIRRAMHQFGHAGKIQAISELAKRLSRDGFSEIKRRIDAEGIAYLQSFAFLGPATSVHLAKNLGYDVVKPDRHLTRVANALGAANPTEMCQRISVVVGDRLAVVDLVIWRYATLDSRYIEHFLGRSCSQRSAA